MSRRELLVWLVVMVAASLACAWLIERRHILTLREQLDAWGSSNASPLEGS